MSFSLASLYWLAHCMQCRIWTSDKSIKIIFQPAKLIYMRQAGENVKSMLMSAQSSDGAQAKPVCVSIRCCWLPSDLTMEFQLVFFLQFDQLIMCYLFARNPIVRYALLPRHSRNLYNSSLLIFLFQFLWIVYWNESCSSQTVVIECFMQILYYFMNRNSNSN